MPRKRVMKVSGCEGKYRYDRDSDAAETAIAMRHRYGDAFRPYRCLICHGWHVGKDAQRRRY